MGTPRHSTLLPGILSKRAKHNRDVECGHSQGINFVTRHPLKACRTQYRDIECGHSQCTRQFSERACARAEHPYGARIQLRAAIYPDIASKHVEHNRHVESGHCQGINFVTRHPPKACKTQ